MARDDSVLFTSARELVRELRALGDEPVPASLVAATLVRVGLADGCWTLTTPLGPVYIAYSEAGISAVMSAASPEAFAETYHAQFGRQVHMVNEPPAALAHAVKRQLRGEGGQPPRFDLRGLSDFERAVLLKALEIPRGEVRPYAWVAREIGRPKAVRAVGTALARNPIPLLIPCHRVVRSDGRLGQYSLIGPEAKRTVLAAEGVAIDALEAHAQAGVRFSGSDTTHIYCYPTCHHARRITDLHRVLFATQTEAAAAGYRPCRACRPAQAS